MMRSRNRSCRRITVGNAARLLRVAVTLGCVAAAGAAGAAEPPTYEPGYRYRLRTESCKKDEAELGARCAKQCQPGYRMEQQGVVPVCRRKT